MTKQELPKTQIFAENFFKLTDDFQDRQHLYLEDLTALLCDPSVEKSNIFGTKAEVITTLKELTGDVEIENIIDIFQMLNNMINSTLPDNWRAFESFKSLTNDYLKIKNVNDQFAVVKNYFKLMNKFKTVYDFEVELSEMLSMLV
jgi:hypothetical protein